ncbi:hypothetical protein Ancab_012051 [Ancistrocladus abbreviatus]
MAGGGGIDEPPVPGGGGAAIDYCYCSKLATETIAPETTSTEETDNSMYFLREMVAVTTENSAVFGVVAPISEVQMKGELEGEMTGGREIETSLAFSQRRTETENKMRREGQGFRFVWAGGGLTCRLSNCRLAKAVKAISIFMGGFAPWRFETVTVDVL